MDIYLSKVKLIKAYTIIILHSLPHYDDDHRNVSGRLPRIAYLFELQN